MPRDAHRAPLGASPAEGKPPAGGRSLPPPQAFPVALSIETETLGPIVELSEIFFR